MSREDQIIQLFEQMADKMEDEHIQTSANIVIMKTVRGGLITSGMSRSYADQLIARSTINVTDDLEAHQMSKLTDAVHRIAYNFHHIFTEAGFNDETIALMGSQLTIEITS